MDIFRLLTFAVIVNTVHLNLPPTRPFCLLPVLFLCLCRSPFVLTVFWFRLAIGLHHWLFPAVILGLTYRTLVQKGLPREHSVELNSAPTPLRSVPLARFVTLLSLVFLQPVHNATAAVSALTRHRRTVAVAFGPNGNCFPFFFFFFFENSWQLLSMVYTSSAPCMGHSDHHGEVAATRFVRPEDLKCSKARLDNCLFSN